MTIGDRDKVFANLTNPEAAPSQESPSGAGETKLGLVVRDISPAMAQKIHTSGVEIESVRTGSFADMEQLEPGEVITKVNKQPTGTRDQFEAVVSKLKVGDDVVFEVLDPKHPEAGIMLPGGVLQ